MRNGWLEVVMASPDGQRPYAEAEVPAGSGARYTAVNPGDEYCILVTVYRDEQGKFPANFWRVGLYVDGHDVNYWKRVDSTSVTAATEFVTTVFWGFKKGGDDMRQFKVARASQSATSSAACAQNSSVGGKITAIVHAAEVTTGVFNNVGKTIEIPTDSNISDKQKFYSLPSAVTVGGKRARDKEVFLPLSRWRNISDEPLQTITLLYHTQEMLNAISAIGTATATTAVVNEAPLIVDNSNLTDDGEIEILPVVKIIPILDLTEDDASTAWSVKAVSKI